MNLTQADAFNLFLLLSIFLIGFPLMGAALARFCNWKGLVQECTSSTNVGIAENFRFQSIAVSYRRGIYVKFGQLCRVSLDQSSIVISCYFPFSISFQPICILWTELAKIEHEGKWIPITILHHSNGGHRIAVGGKLAQAIEENFRKRSAG